MRVRDNEGFTLIELLIVVAIIILVAAVAVPTLLRARMAGNEASAIGSLRTINSSQQAYSLSCASNFYAAELPTLLVAPTAGGGAAFISPDLGAAVSVVKSGYTVTVIRGSDGAAGGTTTACNAATGAALHSSYVARAEPVSTSVTGTRYFWTNTQGTIYQHTTSVAATTGNTEPATGTPIG